MKTDEIKRRLTALEGEIPVSGALCLVRLPDGSDIEVSLSEWLDHCSEWKMIKITKGKEISPLLCSLLSMESETSDSDPVRIRAVKNIRLLIERIGGIS